MKLTDCIVACDNNPDYLEFWPLVYRAWTDLVGIKVTLVLVADEIPEDLEYQSNVVLFKPIKGVPTPIQTQCIRLLYPSVLETRHEVDAVVNGKPRKVNMEGAVIISDMDMIPCRKSYFVNAIEQLPNNRFVIYHDILRKHKEVRMCYNAAIPSVWRKLFLNGAENAYDKMRTTIKAWYKRYNGKWTTDQQVLYNIVMKHQQKLNQEREKDFSITVEETFTLLGNWVLNYKQLDRAKGKDIITHETTLMDVKLGAYSDYHMLRPPNKHVKENYLVAKQLPGLEDIKPQWNTFADVYACHRVNTKAELSKIPEYQGVEVDVRDYMDRLVVSHDPFKDGELFDDYLEKFKHQLIVVDIKSEGIEYRVKEVLQARGIENYVLINSTPMMIHTLTGGKKQDGSDTPIDKNMAVRFSEFESIRTVEALKDRCNWVWVDCFTTFPLNREIYKCMKEWGYKICVVSPELHSHKLANIDTFKQHMIDNDIKPDVICCKLDNIKQWEVSLTTSPLTTTAPK